jgi:hypothetical protein
MFAVDHAGCVTAAADNIQSDFSLCVLKYAEHHQVIRRKAIESRAAAQPHVGLPFRYSSTTASSQPVDAETVP